MNKYVYLIYLVLYVLRYPTLHCVSPVTIHNDVLYYVYMYCILSVYCTLYVYEVYVYMWCV